jgi:cephalosporin-C deacetylase-like acetyl esterase
MIPVCSSTNSQQDDHSDVMYLNPDAVWFGESLCPCPIISLRFLRSLLFKFIFTSNLRLLLIGVALTVATTFAHADEVVVPPLRPAPVFVDLPANGTVSFKVTPDESKVPAHFRLADHEFRFDAEDWYTHAAVRVSSVRLPSPVTTDIQVNNTVHAEYFQPAGKGPHPSCIVLHILGGDFLLSRTVANHLAQHGVAALFVKMPYYGPRRDPKSPRRMISRDPNETVASMTQAVLDIRRAAAWLRSRPELNPDQVGVMGISLGGIMSALAGAAEPQFDSVAIFLGGGNFAEFLWDSPLRQAEEFRRDWIAAGGTRDSFAKTLVSVDPVTHGPLLRGRRVLMVESIHDEVIPAANAIALHESIGREPRIVWLNAGHYTAIWYLPRELVRLETFFKR